MIVNVITRPKMKLEHLEDLSLFYECRTFLYKKILGGYVRILDLSSFLPPLLNNVGLKRLKEAIKGGKIDVKVPRKNWWKIKPLLLKARYEKLLRALNEKDKKMKKKSDMEQKLRLES